MRGKTDSPLTGEPPAIYMLPGLGSRAALHKARQKVGLMVHRAVRLYQGSEQFVFLRLTSAMLEPLLECGTVAPAYMLKERHPNHGYLERAYGYLDNDNTNGLVDAFWGDNETFGTLCQWIERRLMALGAWDTWPSDEIRDQYLEFIFRVALIIVSPHDVARGLPSYALTPRSVRAA